MRIKLTRRWYLTQHSLRRLSVGAVGGIAACAVVSILLILLAVFIWLRRKRRRRDSSIGLNRDIEIPNSKSKRPYGTGPVTPHTPSLPPLPLATAPPSDSPMAMVSVSPIEYGSDNTDEGFTISVANSRTRLIPSDMDHRSDGELRGAGPSEISHGAGQVGREEMSGAVSPPLYPPVITYSEEPSRRNSMQVGCNFSFILEPPMLSRVGLFTGF